MKLRLILLFIFFFRIGILPLSAQEATNFNPAKARYAWPTEASRYLSSTFGETRSAHFHAALDIKTWGRRGYKVYATRDGIVDRIAIGPRGYGKVVYLRHPDDSYSVYAHLLSFNEDLQQLADSIRFAGGYKFEIERFLTHRNITVKQGDVIGFSGASGIGPPHLHFELRTPSQKPFNPLLTNLSVRDDIPPKIRSVSIEPASPASSIEGKNAIFTKRTRLHNGQYDLGTVQVSGPVGLGINAFDQSNRVHNRYAIYELGLSVNGKQLFASKVDSFSYYETNQMFIDRVYPLLQNYEKGYQRLFIADGNTLPFYQTDKQKGVLDLPPGKHEVTITAKDFFGNRSNARLTILVKNSPSKNQINYQPSSKPLANRTTISPNNWQWFENWVTLSNQQFQNITMALSNNDQLIHHSNGISIPLKNQERAFFNIPGTGPVSFYRIEPQKNTFISTDNQKNFARFPQEAFYDTLSIGMTVNKFTADSISVEIIPDRFPIKNEYEFYIERDSVLQNTEQLSFYHWDHVNEEWDWIPTEFSDYYIISKTKALGTFALKKDMTPPEVKNPRVRQHPNGKWVVLIDAIDDLSGIDYKTAEIRINGQRGIAEFEPEDDRFLYYHPNFQPTQSMKVQIVVQDKMGNKTKRTFRIQTNKAK